MRAPTGRAAASRSVGARRALAATPARLRAAPARPARVRAALAARAHARRAGGRGSRSSQSSTEWDGVREGHVLLAEQADKLEPRHLCCVLDLRAVPVELVLVAGGDR